jgi:hypothetical protein
MNILVALALLYGGVAGGAYVFQRRLLYHPDVWLSEPREYGLAGFARVAVPTRDGLQLVAWQAPASGDRPVIVYLQGNAEGLASRHERFEIFHADGYGVLAIGYRGFSGSPGSPSEAGLMADAEAAIAFLEAAGVAPRRIVVFGESLGTAPAIRLAAAGRAAAVILESPFTSALDVARRAWWFLPLGLMMKDQFLSLDHAHLVAVPAFVFHGTADAVVPYAHGVAIHAALAGPKEFHAIPEGTHVAPLTEPLWALMKDFLSRHLPSG